jgi:hypothetical protein
MLIRLVNIEHGILHRFGFIPMWLELNKPTKFEYLIRTLAVFELKEEGVTLRQQKDVEIFVNGHPINDECILSHGDELVIKWKKAKLDFQFQSDLALVKNKRLQEELALGIIREPPDLSSNEKPIRKLHDICTIDERQIGVKGLHGITYIRWNELDEITFSPQKVGGFTSGFQSQVSVLKSGMSENEPIFEWPFYTVRFNYNCKELACLIGIEPPACVLINQAVECYSTIDLVRFI